MTIYREDCGYEPLTPERAAEFGVPEDEVGLWLIEYEYGDGPLMPTWKKPGDSREPPVSVRVIPNTMARIAAGKGILILGDLRLQ